MAYPGSTFDDIMRQRSPVAAAHQRTHSFNNNSSHSSLSPSLASTEFGEGGTDSELLPQRAGIVRWDMFTER